MGEGLPPEDRPTAFTFDIKTPAISPASHGAEWAALVASYRGEKSFPVGAEQKPAWSTAKEQDRGTADRDNEGGVPAGNVRVTVTFADLDLTVVET
jgi:hypothetical protein